MPRINGFRELKKSVGESGLAVVYVGDDAEVADAGLVHWAHAPRIGGKKAARGQVFGALIGDGT